MATCNLCGKKIKPYFDVCFDCYQKNSAGSFQFPESTLREEFIESRRLNCV